MRIHHNDVFLISAAFDNLEINQIAGTLLIRKQQIPVRQLADHLFRLNVEIRAAVGLGLGYILRDVAVIQIIDLTAHRIGRLNLKDPIQNADAGVVLASLLGDNIRQLIAFQIRRQRVADIFDSFNFKALIEAVQKHDLKQPQQR